MHSIWVALQWEQRHEYDFLETITVAHSCPRLQLLTPKASKLHKSHSEESLISILFEALYFYLEIHSNPQIWSERLCRHRALIAGCMCPANMCHTHTRTCMTHIHTHTSALVHPAAWQRALMPGFCAASRGEKKSVECKRGSWELIGLSIFIVNTTKIVLCTNNDLTDDE